MSRLVERLEGENATLRTAAEAVPDLKAEIAALRAVLDVVRADAERIRNERDKLLTSIMTRRSWWPFRRSA